MTIASSSVIERKKNVFNFYDYHEAQDDFYNEIVSGLSLNPKTLSPKFLYDEYGSQLFSAICETPEYYPTRTEQAIIESNIEAIASNIGTDCLIIEPGSGSCEKVKTLLTTLNPVAYMPLDISKEYLRQTAEQVSQEFPFIEIHAACVDYTSPFSVPEFNTDAHKVAFYPGSSIGNFDPEHARSFLVNLAQTIGKGGGLLIGVDRKKDVEILNKAYDDSAGVTASFNKNLLSRINSELDANFDLSKFSHHACYNDKLGRVEMHLVSDVDQSITINDLIFSFKKGDSIHTESSYKYSNAEFQQLALGAGFKAIEVWSDAEELFSVYYFEVE
ncbi:ABC transporter, ATP-binding protein [hydrothermal vent metagenome]|uniref:ABC transporter, ATP-binding protein n=1 Tax=hydrothermal vent metagenome TaxID=652676 RepID=A0A3B0Y665_9ZZZZ